MRQVSIRLDDDLEKRLDAELAAFRKEHGGFGPTRSDLLREALEKHLKEAERKRAGAKKVS